MTRNEISDYLHMVLSQAAGGPPPGPRPSGTFVGNSPRDGVSGLRLVAPDGTTFYLAVLELNDFDEEPG
jgi:hypothetical protein